MSRVIGEAGNGGPQALVASPPPPDAARPAALVGDRGDAGLGSEMILGLEAGSYVTEFGGDLSGANLAGRGKDMTTRPSGSSATACSMRRVSLAI